LGWRHRFQRALPANLAPYRALLPKEFHDVPRELLGHVAILTRLWSLWPRAFTSNGGLGIIDVMRAAIYARVSTFDQEPENQLLVDPEYTVLVKLDKERARLSERFDAFPSTLNLPGEGGRKGS
jgi:hypothetical protein